MCHMTEINEGISLRVVKAASQEKSCYNIHVRNYIIMTSCDSLRFGLSLAQGHYFSIVFIHITTLQ